VVQKLEPLGFRRREASHKMDDVRHNPAVTGIAIRSDEMYTPVAGLFPALPLTWDTHMLKFIPYF
jgi:hypothetical protein